MKRIAVVLILLFLLTGCADIKQTGKHIKSAFSGLDRIATLYATDGSVIRQWQGNIQVETGEGGYYRMLTEEGKIVYIDGTLVIEER